MIPQPNQNNNINGVINGGDSGIDTARLENVLNPNMPQTFIQEGGHDIQGLPIEHGMVMQTSATDKSCLINGDQTINTNMGDQSNIGGFIQTQRQVNPQTHLGTASEAANSVIYTG